jgi:hypothetical protein
MTPRAKKPHVATGKPHGGARPGAGRKPGIPNALPTGMVKALKALSLRVPADASEEAKELADRALQRVADVMDGKVHSSIATPVLKAATHLREEICGPIVRKIEIDGKIGLSAILDEMEALPEHAEEAGVVAAEAVIEAEVIKPPVEPKGPIIRRKGATVQ